MISGEQAKNIKQQLIQQINSTFPEDKKQSAIQQLEAMNNEQLEQFLIQNNLIKAEEGLPGQSQAGQQCIFCSIVFGDIQSYKIDENADAIAVLEINPISKGHSLIIPKNHIESQNNLPDTVLELAKKVAKNLKLKLNPQPKEISLANANLFGHEIINVLPVYGNETPQSQRQQAKPEELQELKTLLQTQDKPKPTQVTEEIKTEELNPEKLWLPKRIP